RRHTRFSRDWSSDVCSSDLTRTPAATKTAGNAEGGRQDQMADGMGSTPQLRVEDGGSVRWLIVDNPARLNAFTTSMWATLPRLRSEERRVGKECRAGAGACR